MNDAPQIDRRMLEAWLSTTHTTLEYDSDCQERCQKQNLPPIRDGIPIMLVIRRVRLMTRPNASNTAGLLCQGLRLLG